MPPSCGEAPEDRKIATPETSPTGGITTHKGYFVIADISGYTRFVAQNELEHAQGVLHELVTLVMERLGAPLQFIALEGGAVFCYAPDASVSDAEHLIHVGGKHLPPRTRAFLDFVHPRLEKALAEATAV